jgi:hypothetical protein
MIMTTNPFIPTVAIYGRVLYGDGFIVYKRFINIILAEYYLFRGKGQGLNVEIIYL